MSLTTGNLLKIRPYSSSELLMILWEPFVFYFCGNWVIVEANKRTQQRQVIGTDNEVISTFSIVLHLA